MNKNNIRVGDKWLINFGGTSMRVHIVAKNDQYVAWKQDTERYAMQKNETIEDFLAYRCAISLVDVAIPEPVKKPFWKF